MSRIIVTEYPKSGGSWVVSLLGDAFGLPKRDIYVNDGYSVFDVRKHPWYEGAPNLGLTESCVIKSHELPDSPLISFPAQFLHLIRDGRDVVVSKYFYEKEFCVANGIYVRFDVSFDEYVPQVATEWREYVLAWLGRTPYTYKYEDFLRDAARTLRKVAEELEITVPDSQVVYAVEANTKDKFKHALDKTFKHNTFVRRGVVGDWKNHFSDKHIQIFKEIAGDTLVQLRYERDLHW